MRLFFSAVTLLFLTACGGPGDNLNKTDSVNNADSASLAIDATAYSVMVKGAIELKLPALIESSEMQKLPGLMLNDASGYDLLPGDFEPQSYKSVYCVGRSVISGEVSALWFKFTSPGEYEDGPETIDFMMVLYDNAGAPLDVCMVASSAVGYSYSYVRTDSLFTIEVDEMENINVTTYGVEIRKDGFMSESATTTTFQPDAAGKKEGEMFRNEFIDAHKQ